MDTAPNSLPGMAGNANEMISQMASRYYQMGIALQGVKVFISPHVALPPKFEVVRVPVPRRGIVRKLRREVQQPDQVVMIGHGTMVMSPQTAQKLEQISQEELDVARLLLGRRLGEAMESEITVRWGKNEG